jgi:hypothetical protein
MTLAICVIAAVMVGFLVGLLTSRSASRWCPTCGVTLICPERHPAETVDRPVRRPA